MVSRKAFKFGGAMAPMELADYRAGLGVERGKQIDGAVTHVIRAAALALAGPPRQHRLAAITRLSPALLLHAQHPRPPGSIQVQPRDAAHFFPDPRLFPHHPAPAH